MSDAEMAFLDAQQQEYDPAADFAAMAADADQEAEESPEQSPISEHNEMQDEREEEEEYDPDSAFAEPVEDARPSSVQPVSTTESANNTPQPDAASALKPQPTDASAAPTPSKQPRTKGGFVDESEDDEDEMPVAKPKVGSALLNAAGVAETPQRSVTESPNNTHAPQAMPSISAQDQAVPGVPSLPVAVPDNVSSFAVTLPNSSTPVPDATKTGIAAQSNVASASTSVSKTPTSAALPKPRLPQDRIGIFEDRIAEDPRGDTEAWLSLIDEHRKRHKIEDARAVYDRFFQVFPSAVS